MNGVNVNDIHIQQINNACYDLYTFGYIRFNVGNMGKMTDRLVNLVYSLPERDKRIRASRSTHRVKYDLNTTHRIKYDNDDVTPTYRIKSDNYDVTPTRRIKSDNYDDVNTTHTIDDDVYEGFPLSKHTHNICCIEDAENTFAVDGVNTETIGKKNSITMKLQEFAAKGFKNLCLMLEWCTTAFAYNAYGYGYSNSFLYTAKDA
tara:strand:+ start:159 stop:770 length:612 start_codon:yes stop_codon:yes gene_type:complete